MEKKDGIASGKTRAFAKTFKEKINEELTEQDLKEIIRSVIKEAKKGNIKALEVLRDTRGEKPKENISVGVSYEDYIKKVEDEEEY